MPREARKRNRRKEESPNELEGNQADRPVFLPKRTTPGLIRSKERKLSKKRDATTAFGHMVTARKERVSELRMLMDLETDPLLIESRRKALMDFLDSAPPICTAVETSGMCVCVILQNDDMIF